MNDLKKNRIQKNMGGVMGDVMASTKY